MKKRVIIGDEFESLDASLSKPVEASADVIDAVARVHEGNTRTRVTYGTLGFTALSIIVAGVIGFRDGTFDELERVWAVAGPVVGAIFWHYFGGTAKRE